MMMKATNFRYTGVNLILVVLAFLAGSHGLPGEAKQRQAAAEVHQRDTTTGPVKPRPHTDQKYFEIDQGSAADGLSADEIKRLLGSLGPLNSERGYDRMQELLLALAAKDPNAAIDYVLRTLKPPFQNQALNGVLGVWAGNDGRSAWNWVKANRAGDSLLTGTVLGKTGSLQPDAAWQFAAELATNRPDQAAGLYVSAMSGMLYAGKYPDAVRLLNSGMMPTNALQSSPGLTSLLASQWGAFSPADAAQWVLTLPDGEVKNRALLALGQSWAGVDPGQAVAFASQLPPGTERVSMLEAGLNSWVVNDPAAAGTWMSSIPAGPDYDQFASAIANTPAIVNNTPESSVAWAMSISDQNLKMESVISVFTEWFHSADGPAMGYLKQMPPEIQDAVCQRLGLRTALK